MSLSCNELQDYIIDSFNLKEDFPPIKLISNKNNFRR